MRVLGLDLSTITGVSIVTDAGDQSVLYADEVQFKKETGLQRCSDIANAIMTVKRQYKPDFAVVEGYGFGNKHTLATLVEIGTVVRYFLWQEDFPFYVIAPSALKKYITGKGNAKKDLIILEVYKKLGYEAATNNIADAVALAYMGLQGKCS